MQRGFIETRLLPIAVIGLYAYAYGQPHPPAATSALAAGLGLAVVVLVRAIGEYEEVFKQPLTIRVTSFALSRIIMPVLMLLCGVTALIFGGRMLEVAMVMAVTLAVVSML